MDNIRELFEYQRFDPNPKLQQQIDVVYRRHLAYGQPLSDDSLDLAAAGDPWKGREKMPPGAGGPR